MKFLLLNADYPEFLRWLYAEHPGLECQGYEEQMTVRHESLSGWADFYPSNLRRLGHEARNIHFTNAFMQRAWAREHGMSTHEPPRIPSSVLESLQRVRRRAYATPLRLLRPVLGPLLDWLGSTGAWRQDVLARQIKHYRPDVLLNQSIGLSSGFLSEMRPYARLLVGQHASPLPQGQELGVYDLILASLPNFVDHFRRHGVASELLRLGFEPTVLQHLGPPNKSSAVSFVGSLLGAHASRRRFLNYVCQRVPVEVWGHGFDHVSRDSPIHSRYNGTAWGLRMYRILQSSQISLNHHIDVAERYANNMRLFEATGVGTLLITDWKSNLHEMFKLAKEVVAYRSPEECVELIQYYLEHEEERDAIARAGQHRTLREHTYYHRMQELVYLVQQYL